ncbi:unnamed protein product [Pedinophyceae sp. YPF-701]|nr:unnamed protein product [Pedinophyceae sp. YPF-701]
MSAFRYAPVTSSDDALARELEGLGGGDATVGALQCVVRVCPLANDESQRIVHARDDSVAVTDPTTSDDASVDARARRYRVHRAHGPGASQGDVHGPLLQDVLRWLDAGFHAAVIAYGQEGTGKTYTLFGPGGTHSYEQIGLVPVLARALLDKCEGRRSLELGMSVWELRGQTTVDLLRTGKPDDGRVQVQNLPGAWLEFTTGAVATSDDVHALMSLAQRRSANWGLPAEAKQAQPLVALPNRAHFFVRFVVYDRAQERLASVTVADLVGQSSSEELSRNVTAGMLTQASVERREESMNIVSLNRLVAELSRRNAPAAKATPQVVPAVQDCQLTRVLFPFLAGNCRCFMVGTVADSKAHYLDTINTMRILTRAQGIRTACTKSCDVRGEDVRFVSVAKLLSTEAARDIGQPRAAREATQGGSLPDAPWLGGGTSAAGGGRQDAHQTLVKNKSLQVRASGGGGSSCHSYRDTEGAAQTQPARATEAPEQSDGGDVPGVDRQPTLQEAALMSWEELVAASANSNSSGARQGGERTAPKSQGIATIPSLAQWKGDSEAGQGAPADVQPGAPVPDTSGSVRGSEAEGGLATEQPPPAVEHEPRSPDVSRIGAGQAQDETALSPDSQKLVQDLHALEPEDDGAGDAGDTQGQGARGVERPLRPEDVSGGDQNEVLLAMLKAERRKRELAEERCKAIELDRLEQATVYELRLEDARKEATRVNSRCRALQAEVGMAEVFDRYESDIAGLQREVESLRKGHSQALQKAAVLEAELQAERSAASAAGRNTVQQSQASKNKNEWLTKRLSSIEARNEELHLEIAHLKQEERVWMAGKRVNERLRDKVKDLQQKLLHKEQEMVDRSLESRAAVAESQRLADLVRKQEAELDDLFSTNKDLELSLRTLRQQVVDMRVAERTTLLSRGARPINRDAGEWPGPGMNRVMDLVKVVRSQVGRYSRAEETLDRLVTELNGLKREASALLEREKLLMEDAVAVQASRRPGAVRA